MKLISLELKNQKNKSNLLKNLDFEKIKFIKYGDSLIVIVTMNNKVFVYGSNYKGQTGLDPNSTEEFLEINYVKFGIIKFLICSDTYTIIVNDCNEFFVTGTFFGNFTRGLTKREDLIFIDKIKTIRNESNHIFILTTDHFIYGYGHNHDGQLGLPKEIKECREFTKINEMKVKDIQCGYRYSILLDFNGDIYTTGSNLNGALGINEKNTFADIFGFTKVVLPFKVCKIFSDLSSSFILSENNEVYVTGYNGNGQLGTGTEQNLFAYTKLNNLKIKDNQIRFYKSYNGFSFMKKDGMIYTSGSPPNFGIKKSNIFVPLKIVENTKDKFIYPLLMGTKVFILITNYEIKEDIVYENEYNLFNLQLYESLKASKLVDVNFVIKEC